MIKLMLMGETGYDRLLNIDLNWKQEVENGILLGANRWPIVNGVGQVASNDNSDNNRRLARPLGHVILLKNISFSFKNNNNNNSGNNASNNSNPLEWIIKNHNKIVGYYKN